MTDIRGVKFGTPGQAGEGTQVAVHVDPYGNLYSVPAALAYGVSGQVFGANAGVVTTPVQTAATTALTNTIPHLWIRVPDGTAIVPLSAQIVVETSGNTTQIEASVVIAQNDVGTSGSAADAGPISLNTAVPRASTCVARQLGTATTAPTNPLELKRFSAALSASNQMWTWAVDADGLYLPVVRGPGSFAIFIGGNAVNYFSTLIWAEFPESALAN